MRGTSLKKSACCSSRRVVDIPNQPQLGQRGQRRAKACDAGEQTRPWLIMLQAKTKTVSLGQLQGGS